MAYFTRVSTESFFRNYRHNKTSAKKHIANTCQHRLMCRNPVEHRASRCTRLPHITSECSVNTCRAAHSKNDARPVAVDVASLITTETNTHLVRHISYFFPRRTELCSDTQAHLQPQRFRLELAASLCTHSHTHTHKCYQREKTPQLH